MTAIPFKNVPTNLRLPLFSAELDNSKANTNAVAQRALLIGQKTAAGTLQANVPVICQSQSDGRAAAGAGSILAGMIDAYRSNDATGEMWVLPLADDPGAAAATGSMTFTGPTTVAGTLALYIAGRLISVALASVQTAAQVAATVAAAINAAVGVPVTAVVDGATAGKVNLTARNAGLCGNDIDIRLNYKGTAGGEITPAGLAMAVVAMADGATNPSLVTGLGNLLDQPFDFVVCSLTDAASLAQIASLLSDATGGRWSWTSQVYGHCWYGYRGTAGACAAQASALNNQHLTQKGFNDSPSPAWKWAAAFAAAEAVSLRTDPGVPLQNLTVLGILAPPLASRFGPLVRNNTLLYGGVSTWTVDATGNVTGENSITTYVTNASGQADDSYLEVEDLFLLAYVMRQLASLISTKYSRVKLAADGTRAGPDANVVTPSVIRGDLIAQYGEMEAAGMVQGTDTFSAGLVVQQNATNPNRVDVLYPAILIDQLRVFATLVQFRLTA